MQTDVAQVNFSIVKFCLQCCCTEEWNKVFKIIKEYPQKDINGDGNIDIADLNIALNIMLHKEDVTAPYEADVNADGTVDIADINMIINGILGK